MTETVNEGTVLLKKILAPVMRRQDFENLCLTGKIDGRVGQSTTYLDSYGM